MAALPPLSAESTEFRCLGVGERGKSGRVALSRSRRCSYIQRNGEGARVTPQ